MQVYGDWPRSGEITIMESLRGQYATTGGMNVGGSYATSTNINGTSTCPETGLSR